MSSLTFDKLREQNVQRCEESFHKLNDWSSSDWMTALTGEVGEAANLIKKVRRGSLTRNEALPEIAKELADIQCYLDLLAASLGVDLGEETIKKFDEVSARVGSERTLRD